MPVDVKGLREIAEKATQGNWWYQGEADAAGGQFRILSGIKKIAVCLFGEGGRREQHANVRFMVAAQPSTVLALLDEIERLHGASDTEIALHAENVRLLDENERKDRALRQILYYEDEYGLFVGAGDPAGNILDDVVNRARAALSPATPREEMSNETL